MKGWVFDPNRLACSSREQERRGYAMAARLLREYLGGGDIFAEVREQVQARMLREYPDADDHTPAPRQAVRRSRNSPDRYLLGPGSTNGGRP